MTIEAASKFDKLTPKSVVYYCANPAERPFLRVRFVRWFDRERSYVRIQLPSNVFVSVPREQIFVR